MKNETVHIRNNIFLEMQNYSLGLDDERFTMQVVSKKQKEKLYTLYEELNSLYILAPIVDMETKELMAVVMTPSGAIMVPYVKNTAKVQKVSYPKIGI